MIPFGPADWYESYLKQKYGAHPTPSYKHSNRLARTANRVFLNKNVLTYKKLSLMPLKRLSRGSIGF